MPTRHDDKLDWRPPIADGPREFNPIHRSRHFDIRNDDTDIFPRLQDGNRFISIAGFDYIVPGILKYQDRLHAYDVFIFHYQHDEFDLLWRFMHVAMTFLPAARAAWLEKTTCSLGGHRSPLALLTRDGNPRLRGPVPLYFQINS
jgi:hypothetical protein